MNFKDSDNSFNNKFYLLFIYFQLSFNKSTLFSI